MKFWGIFGLFFYGRLGLWNRGAFDELINDTYNSVIGYLEKTHGNKTTEERHRTFLNLVLKGKLRKAVQFICDREQGGGLKP